MAIRSRTTQKYRGSRPVDRSDDEELKELDLDEAREKFNKAKETYIEAIRKKRSPHKTTNREELTSAGRTILKGAGSLVDDFFDGADRITRSVERDIRKHSIQGQIDDTIIRALMSKNRKSSSKTTSKRPNVYVEIRGIDGRPAIVNVKDIPAALRRKGR